MVERELRKREYDMRKTHYSEPKGRIFEQAQNLRDVVIFGRDADGALVSWSSLDERATEALLKESQLTPVG
jgi:hypothetical protein